MSLATGSRLGPYEVAALIGTGGMGEVYRARDTKLGRDVALKVLPAALTGDGEYMARFHREAQVLASLNHPHIASIYGIEESGNTKALVMELVAGPTLADRIQESPLSLAEALELAKQIAEALEYAHEKGVIHRDLKPANVKLTAEGMVKLLDFGLAKAQSSESKQWENAETLPVSMSRPGVIMGTPAYMAPEQARGEPVDKRADIWAFGVLLLEMLTGKRTFTGDTTSDTLAAVLTRDPDWEQLPAGTPANTRRLLRRCLEKDPKKRLRDIGDARLEMEGSPAELVSPELPARRGLLPWAVSTGLLAALAAVLLLYFRQASPEGPLMQYSIPPPEGHMYEHIAPSPDGRMLAFVTGPTDSLWLRRLDSLTAQPLAGADGVLLPFWSPDSRFLGFWAYGQRKLKVIDLEAPAGPGRIRTLCDAPWPGGATWSSRDGVIVFSGGRGFPLFRTTASGGEVGALTKLDPARQERSHLWPWFLPDGRHFLYTVVSDKRENSGVYVGMLDSAERQRLTGDLSNAAYVNAPSQGGLLLFVRGESLMAQHFDAARQRLSAQPFPVAENIEYGTEWAQGFFAASENGVLAYLRGAQSQLAWFDRNGKRIGTIGEPGTHVGGFALSPDDKHIAVARRDSNTGTSDIWLIEISNGVFFTRFTFDPGEDSAPIWSPDGKRIVFSSNREGAFDLYRKDATGEGREEPLFQSRFTKWARDWSRDSRFLLYGETDYTLHNRFWLLPLFGERRPVPFQKTSQPVDNATFSPDGKWVAFESLESDRSEIYVSAVPETETEASPVPAKWQLSHGGGTRPQWRRDGRELYYLAEKKFMSVELGSNPTSRPGIPRLLFEVPSLYHEEPRHSVYAVTSDGQRFLLLTTVETGPRALTMVLNWTKGSKP